MKNLKTKKSLTWGLLILAGLVVFGYMQLGWFNKTFDYLISVTAEDGAVIGAQDTNGCFDLTLKGAEHVIWFSDRPERSAFSTDIPSLLNIWPEEFGTNPPNADLQLFRDDSDALAILTLKSTPVWDEGTRTLRFDKACPIELAGVNQTISNIVGNAFSKAVLFIDGAHAVKNPRISFTSEPEPSAWNACSGNNSRGDDTCMQEWGTYDSECETILNVQYTPGKNCRDVCDKYISYATLNPFSYESTNPLYICTDFTGYLL